MKNFLKLVFFSLLLSLSVSSCKNNNEPFVNTQEKETFFSNLKKDQTINTRAIDSIGDIDGKYTFKLTRVTMNGELPDGLPPLYVDEDGNPKPQPVGKYLTITEKSGTKLNIISDAFKVGKMPGELTLRLIGLNYSKVSNTKISISGKVEKGLELVIAGATSRNRVEVSDESYIQKVSDGVYKLHLEIESHDRAFYIKKIDAYVHIEGEKS